MAKAVADSRQGSPQAPSISRIVEAGVLPAWTRANEAFALGLTDPIGAIRPGRMTPVATLRAQAQRIDATAETALCGLGGATAPRAALLLARTLQQFLAADGEAGFPRAVDIDGVVADPVRDFDSHAWLLRAVAKVYALTGAPETLLVADLILDFLDSSLAHGVAGYRADGSGGRLLGQRGHLRLLEGVLILHRFSRRRADFARAEGLVELFRYHFLDRSAGAVSEYFDMDWRAVHPGEPSFRPRTSAQWIVALGGFRAQGGDAGLAAEIAMLRRGLGAALDEGGFLPEAVDGAGRPLADGFELATQLAHFSALRTLDGVSDAGGRSLGALDEKIAATFLDPAVKGCWIECIDARGASRGAPPRVSTLSSLVELAGLRQANAAAGDGRLLAFPAGERRAAYAA